MRLSSTVWSICLLATTVPLASAQTSSTSPSGTAYVLEPCLIMAILDARVPAREAGILVAMEVRDGLKVKAGQMLAQIADDKPQQQKKLAQLEHDAAKMQAENDIDMQVAQKAAELTKVDFAEATDARRRVPNSVSNFEYRRKEFTWQRQLFEVKQASRDHEMAALSESIARQKVLVADNEINRRQVTAPFAGVIDETFPHVGEWVSPSDPIVYLVNMDRLRVQGYVNANDFAAHEIYGRPVTIEVILSRDEVKQQEEVERFTSKINYVSTTVDAVGQFRVYAEFNNKLSRDGFYVVRPGLPARMILNAGTATAEAPTSRR